MSHDYRTGLPVAELAAVAALGAPLAGRVTAALDACRARGVYLRVSYVARDPWTQARLYRQSRDTAAVASAARQLRDRGASWLAGVLESVGPQPSGAWATNALPGDSWHQWCGTASDPLAGAVDVIWMVDGTRVSWDTSPGSGYATWRAEGVRAGLCMGPERDWAHLQGRPEGGPSSVYRWPAIDAAMRGRWEGRGP